MRTRLLTALLTVAILFTVLPASAQAADSTRTAEQSFVAKINAERRKAGLRPLVESTQMTRIARAWSAQMAGGKGLAHNPSRTKQVDGPWRRLGENVGYARQSGATEAQLVNRIHAAFMKSQGHRKNVLGQFNQVGIGIVVGRDGTMWVTENFLNGPVGAFPLFADTSGSTHEASVEAVWLRQISHGCRGGGDYCPTRAVTRGQMASFLTRALDLPLPKAGSGFSDVSGVHAPSVAALAKAEITGGCESGRFCPDRPVTRAQMATFLVRALGNLDAASTTSGSRFSDVAADYSHAASVNAVAAAGITTGCGGDRFCPARAVTRAQMATFLARALRL